MFLDEVLSIANKTKETLALRGKVEDRWLLTLQCFFEVNAQS